ncbi:hypothetical protein GCM10022289_38990 [Pedobacter jeongneungensis]|uniref:DUF8188 domain-containing protein n=1 Tax=Pedobacter jeongneungensis TaxID=947309 RepID=A0ABP8BN31_9SPHI
MSKQFLGWIIGVFILFPLFVFLYNKITVRKNDGKKYYNIFFNGIAPMKLSIPKEDPYYLSEDNVGFDSYRAGASAIGFKSLNGNIISVRFREPTIKKYFIVSVYDVNDQLYFPLSESMYGKEITAWVNQDDLKDPSYGTKEKPIPVFNFKGMGEPIRITSESEGSVNGYESLEPTNEQYKHNVLTYLTYIMPKDEFKKRFGKQ